MNIKVKICDKAIELIDLLANMPLADDEFVDEIIDGIRYNEPYRRILRDNGYKEVRCCGSHQTWSNGASKITLPTVKLSPVIAARLIKENDLSVR